jgi:hypothetical protein
MKSDYGNQFPMPRNLRRNPGITDKQKSILREDASVG